MSTIALIMAISSRGQNAAQSLPFVGCVSYGMTEKVEAPKGVSVRRSISRRDAGMLAYYKSAEIGLVAPRGWNCEGYSDSSGWGMFLSPDPIKGEPRWPNFKGPAIDLQHISGETGFGSLQIAEAISMAFPTFRAWAMRTLAADADLPRGPYPTDHLRHRSSRVVEFETSPQLKGFSNDFSRFVPNDKPTFGAAILIGNPPKHLLVLSIRLPDELQSLLPLIIEDIEQHRGEN
jgi:hypothetical protein